MVEPSVWITKAQTLICFDKNGFPYLVVDPFLLHDAPLYIPKDNRVYMNYSIKGSIVKGQKYYTIKKSANIVYVVHIHIQHSGFNLQNKRITVDGDLINQLNYDENFKYASYIVRVIEVSPSSKVKIEFDVMGKHYTIVYANDSVETNVGIGDWPKQLTEEEITDLAGELSEQLVISLFKNDKPEDWVEATLKWIDDHKPWDWSFAETLNLRLQGTESWDSLTLEQKSKVAKEIVKLLEKEVNKRDSLTTT